jgi:hypothetical protein
MKAKIRLRDILIVRTGKVFRVLGTIGHSRQLIEGIERTRSGAAVFRWMLGYRRSFRTNRPL